MPQQDIWDVDAAQRYDTPGSGMFAPDVLEPTVARLAELAGDGRALEFAIGTGRVAIPLAERGIPVTGIELSPAMIERLRTKVDDTTIAVVGGDMASSRAPGVYSLVYLVFNTISNLLTQAEQVACFRNAARHLTPGGRFVIELWVPELRRLPPGQQATVWLTESGYTALDTYEVLNQRVVSHHFRFDEGKLAQLFRSPHRYIWPAELDLLAHLAGFELETRHAGPGVPASVVPASDPCGTDTPACLCQKGHCRYPSGGGCHICGFHSGGSGIPRRPVHVGGVNTGRPVGWSIRTASAAAVAVHVERSTLAVRTARPASSGDIRHVPRKNAFVDPAPTISAAPRARTSPTRRNH